ncbi:BEN domain-containing protein 2-like [Trichomycterus rosablanca]|uniref:BEN domain-containing protein 2-like n=1 Tax=Trichomycterus rosablanca TaxID=2290929 RepID=UPI002F35F8B9
MACPGDSEVEMFETDPVRTLGEILAYCQVMYEAIQKLDEKFEMLHARVIHVSTDQPNIEEEPPSLQIYTPDSAEFCFQDNHSADFLHHQTLHPYVSPPVEDSNIPIISNTSEKPKHSQPDPQIQSQPSALTATQPRTVREMLLQQRHISPDDDLISYTERTTSKSPRTVKEILQQRRKRSDTPRSRRTKMHTANPGRKFVIPSSVLTRASTILKPTAAARFLLQSLFSQQELLHGSIKGYVAKGLKKLDPEKISAIREWVQKAYPKLDFSEEGKDWKACTTVMNEGTRYIRLKDRKRKVHDVLQKECRAEEQCEAREQKRNAAGERNVETASVHSFKLEPTAEIDVELSDSDSDDLQQLMAQKTRLKLESDKEEESENEDSCEVYLGSPDREVKVPQYAMLLALQRQTPTLVARHLIRFLFPEDLLVQSNVYGNGKHGIQPLDHNKISALREHMCERFPGMRLDEDGPGWRACVLAINSAIRKTRHARKKCHTQTQELDTSS